MRVDQIDLQKINECLVERYYPHNKIIQNALGSISPSTFLRLLITSHGMQPTGPWLTHTYCKIQDEVTDKNHFFLIPMKHENTRASANIRVENNLLKVDEFETAVKQQIIPHTTPFWYFHYNPNTEETPYESMTLNLSPSCLEKCVLCAGAKTGRVNNGMDGTLDPSLVLSKIFKQHPEAIHQLDTVAVVTGCFENFTILESHLRNVKESIEHYTQPSTFRVLEHNVATYSQFETIVGELGYEVFVTLECFDQEIRNIALNGKVGKKGRNSEEFLILLETYADYLEKHPLVSQPLIRVTYLAGLDSLEVTQTFFDHLEALNKKLRHTKIIPWISIFTSYNKAMKSIQRQNFGLEFLIETMNLSNHYFGQAMMVKESGSTGEGYARGLY